MITLSRQPNAKITVVSAKDPAYPDPRPQSFTYHGGRIYVARVLECWVEAGEWWNLQPECVAWRVMDAAGGVYELGMARTEPPAWRLRTIYD